ncbi:MAG: ABC-F family ATP-binding cassette domain-containing protein [Candidatus Nanopelagicales bacterium]
MAPRNLLNLEKVSKAYGHDPVLDEVSLGIHVGDRVGVVGRNGGGKSTLLQIMADLVQPDSGRVTRTGGVRLGVLTQSADIRPGETVRSFLAGDREAYEWLSQARTRQCLTALLGGFDDQRLDRQLGELSGGERRRVELAALVLDDVDVLILDEPTNHLDIEAVAWLATYLRSQRSLALVVVTHDRWFLDEISDRTWEVVNGSVEEYDGGYSAFVLAKAERARQASTEQAKRNNLIRKELAWLRRGAPARTTKPKFRIDAANELIAAEPPPRDSIELLAFAGSRLGKVVYELEDVSVQLGPRQILRDCSWNVGPGDRIALVGVNGAGKTTLLKVMLGQLIPDSGNVIAGKTVKAAYLSQHLAELDPSWRVLEAIERVANRVELGKGQELTASQLAERLGFDSDGQWTRVAELSGGQRRRLQLARLLMDGPNVLILDEPTNDFDVETLTALEDLLDSFGGTLIVVSHDRYFCERVTDLVFGLLGDGTVRHLPGGIPEYLKIRQETDHVPLMADEPGFTPDADVSNASAAALDATQTRAAKKQLSRLERTIAACDKEEQKLHDQLAEHATDYEKCAELNSALIESKERKHAAELEWMELAEQLEGAG